MLKKRSLQEQLERMKYVSKYTINETPKYRSLVGDGGMDELPEYLMKEADSGSTAPTGAPAPEAPLPDATGGEPQPAGVAPVGAPTAEPNAAPVEPQSDANVEITTAPSSQPEVSAEPMPDQMAAPAPAPVESPEKMVMQLQLDALQKMSYKIEDLGNTIDSLNQRMEIYSNEVEEVREPSDREKFENRKIDSSPYYYNLNDLWDNNNFKARMDQFSRGMVKTEDGYIADFDDLPKLAPHEVKASFDAF